MVDVVTSLVKNAESVNRNFLERLDSTPTRRLISERIKILPDTVRISSTNVTGVFIIGHPVFGEVGTYPIGQGGFVLDHNILGLLDNNNVLDGGLGTSSIIRVLNRNNNFRERFVHTNFINVSSTTADLSTNGVCFFDSGEVLVSDVVALTGNNISNASVSMSGLATENLTASVTVGSSLSVTFTASSDADGSNTNLTEYSIFYT